MRLLLLTASNRQPAWVEEGFADYARRLRAPLRLELKALRLARRTPSMPVSRAIEDEGRRMLAAVLPGAHVVELSEHGAPWSTPELGDRLRAWSEVGAPVCLLVGGPDGLAASCSARAAERWSLSRLTLPHGLVRVVVAEAIYRAGSLLEGHPYHRS